MPISRSNTLSPFLFPQDPNPRFQNQILEKRGLEFSTSHGYTPQISPPSPLRANPSPPNVNVPETLLDPSTSRTTTPSPSPTPSTPISTPISSTSHPRLLAFSLQYPYTSHVMGLKTPIPHLGTPPSPILHPKPTDFLSLTVENASGCGCCDCSEEIDGEFQCPCARLRPGRSGFSEDVGGITEQGFGGELSPWGFFDMVEVDSSGSVSEFGGGAFLGSGGSGFFMCFSTGVKQFQFKQRSTYEFRYRIVNFGRHSPEDVTAVLSSSDKKIMTNMKEIMKRY